MNVPRDVLEVAQERSRHVRREAAAEWLALRSELGDDGLVRHAELAHREREAVAVGVSGAPLARRKQSAAANVRVAIFDVREPAVRDAAADDDWDFVHGFDLESDAVSPVAHGGDLGRRDVRLGADDACDFGQQRVGALLTDVGQEEGADASFVRRA
jgi:hypothetical protein